MDVTQENEIGGFLLSSHRPVAERPQKHWVQSGEEMISKNNADQFAFGRQVLMIRPPFDRHLIRPLQVVIREHLPRQHFLG